MSEFSLRPMEPSDGPAIDELMRNEAQTTAFALSTRYQVDIHEALLAQHPSLYGVVATAAGTDGLVGVATAFIDEVAIGGRLYPSALLENLKVRHDVRRQGLGARLAAWRIDEARRRFGGEGVIVTSVEASNAASLATAHRWSTQLLGPVRIVIARVSAKAPRTDRVNVRAPTENEIPQVVEAVNAFHEGYDLFPRQTPARFAATLSATVGGDRFRHYRVAVAGDGTILAGAAVTERFRLMTDHIERIPRPLHLVSAVVPILPRDRTIRSIELSLAWHAPGRTDAGRSLWDAVRYEWRDHATHATGEADPRSSLMEMFHVGFTFAPRVQLMIPIHSPVPVDETRLVYVWR